MFKFQDKSTHAREQGASSANAADKAFHIRGLSYTSWGRAVEAAFRRAYEVACGQYPGPAGKLDPDMNYAAELRSIRHEVHNGRHEFHAEVRVDLKATPRPRRPERTSSIWADNSSRSGVRDRVRRAMKPRS